VSREGQNEFPCHYQYCVSSTRLVTLEMRHTTPIEPPQYCLRTTGSVT